MSQSGKKTAPLSSREGFTCPRVRQACPRCIKRSKCHNLWAFGARCWPLQVRVTWWRSDTWTRGIGQRIWPRELGSITPCSP